MFFVFPDIFVYWTELDPEVHSQLKAQLLPRINELEEEYRSNNVVRAWDSKLSTSMGHSLDFLTTEFVLNSVVWEPMQAMLSEDNSNIYMPPTSSTLEGIWFNVNNPGEFQEVHMHCPASYSGIYLLDCDEPNPTSFYVPLGRRESKTTFTTEFMKEGTVILFPSDMLHYVKPCVKRRVTIAFNLFCTYNEPK